MRFMRKPKTNEEGYALVISKVPPVVLAECLGLTRQAINRWGGVVPERFVLQVSVITGIPPWDILPETVKETKKRVRPILQARVWRS